MSNLVIEIVLRLAKPGVAVLFAAVILLVAVSLGEPATVALALLSWVAAAAFILLIQESPL